MPVTVVADCLRLLERCLVQSKKEDPKTVCQAFEIIFSLLSKIDEGNDNILFFADEGGSWQVGVDWEDVLPAWFRVLSATAGPSSTLGGLLHFSNVTNSMSG